MTLEKLTIQYEGNPAGSFPSDRKIQALFNPNQLTHTRSATWNRVDSSVLSKGTPEGVMRFGSVQSQTLALSLFFDTYAPYDAAVSGGALGLLSANSAPPKSVADITDKVMNLAKLDPDLHRPPVCRLSWGKLATFLCVLQRATRTYVLFLEDGTPVRATVDCTFMEYPAASTSASELHSSDVEKSYVIRPGDTLMGIAAALYGDVSLWRRIADANGIEDPRVLLPGKSLAIPRIR